VKHPFMMIRDYNGVMLGAANESQASFVAKVVATLTSLTERHIPSPAILNVRTSARYPLQLELADWLDLHGVSTFVSTLGLMRICPGLTSLQS
jgi:hypothetical protein